MPDLKTEYMGLVLDNPVVAGSSTQTISVDNVKRLEDAGVGAVVLKSIFEEQIRSDMAGVEEALASSMHAEALEYLRADYAMQIGPEKYLDRLRGIKAAVKIPVIASVNCVNPASWVSFARKIEESGADGVELNIYDLPDADDGCSADIEKRHLEMIAAVSAEVGIPVAVKISPYYTSIPDFVTRLSQLDIQAIVMFNRFFQPDIDIDELKLKAGINFSTPDDIRLPMRWIAMLRGSVNCDLALTSGVHDAEGVVKAILAGANAVQICSVLYKQGAEAATVIVDGLASWMEQKGFESLADFRGRLSEQSGSNNRGFARAQYVKAFVGVE